MKTRPIAIVDIDGTVAKVPTRRLRILSNPPVDWTAFYNDDFDDEPLSAGINLVWAIRDKMELFFCTSRRECVRQKTQLWIQKHLGLSPQEYTLIMRANDDLRPDYVQKIENFKAETTPEEKERVAFVVDDSNTCCWMWRQKCNYKTLQVS